MNIADLLRAFAKQKQDDGRYDPATEYVLQKGPPGGNPYHGTRNLAWPLADVFREAARAGTFKSGPLAFLAPLVAGASDSPAMLGAVYYGLEGQGCDVWGFDPKRGAIERLADALDSLQSKAKRPHRRNVPTRPLTALQKKAIELWIEKQNIQHVATAMGISRATANQHLKAARRKYPQFAPSPKTPRPTTHALPHDSRGQIHLAGDKRRR